MKKCFRIFYIIFILLFHVEQIINLRFSKSNICKCSSNKKWQQKNLNNKNMGGAFRLLWHCWKKSLVYNCYKMGLTGTFEAELLKLSVLISLNIVNITYEFVSTSSTFRGKFLPRSWPPALGNPVRKYDLDLVCVRLLVHDL